MSARNDGLIQRWREVHALMFSWLTNLFRHSLTKRNILDAKHASLDRTDLSARLMLMRYQMPMLKQGKTVQSLESRMASAPLATLGYLHAKGYNPFTTRR